MTSTTTTSLTSRCCVDVVKLLGTFFIVSQALRHWTVTMTSCHACYVFPADQTDPCRDKRCSFGAQCVPSLDGLTARCQCPERCDNYGDSVDSTPLCATNGNDYANMCEMRRAACSEMREIEKKYEGKCDPCDGVQCPIGQLCKLDERRRALCQCNTVCSRDVNPVCGSDQRTYSNECIMQSEACKNRIELRVISRGECSPGLNPCSRVQCSYGEECQVDRNGKPRCSCPPPCDKIVRPVCGSDGFTYDNQCELRRKACLDKVFITVSHLGQCRQISPCLSHKCQPGASCEVKNGQATCECPKCPRHEFSPVCGSDGKSYDSECQLNLNNCRLTTNVTILYNGQCDACASIQCRSDVGETCIDGKCIKRCPSMADCSTVHYHPVCATDGRTYPNVCAMRSIACRQRKTLDVVTYSKCVIDEFSGSVDAVESNCDEQTTCQFGGNCMRDEHGAITCNCHFDCDTTRSPVCGSDGKIYANQCQLLEESCRSQSEIRILPPDSCQGIYETLCDQSAPAINPTTGKPYTCNSSRFCPIHTYCHRPNSTISACCPNGDGVSEDCLNSRYGCCPDDNTLTAFGPDGAGCPSVCQCNALGSINSRCNPITQQCLCKPSVGGAQCDRCQSSFWGFHKISPDINSGCQPCNCNRQGSVREDCEQMTGRCECKPGYQGDKCQICVNSTAGVSCNDEIASRSVYPLPRRTSAYKALVRTTTKNNNKNNGSNSNSTTTDGMSGHQIRHSERAVTFNGQTFLRYKNAINKQTRRRKSNAYEFNFRTHTDSGLLLLEHKSSTADADYLAIAINKGYVEASFNLGKERIDLGLVFMKSNVNVHDGLWHNVVFNRDNRNAVLSVDYENEVSLTSTAGAETLETDGQLWLGGAGSGTPVGLPVAYHRGLVGCMRSVRVNKQHLHLINDLFQQQPYNQTVAFCHS